MYLYYDGGPKQLSAAVQSSLPLLLKYMVPAGLYCIYNNLVFYNLALFDPGTYNVLMQLRIVMTGVLHQAIFGRKLNKNQWGAMLLITAGCMMKESGKFTGEGSKQESFAPWVLLFMQMCCSVGAGLYNEVLLKDEVAPEVTTNLQNAYMYFHSVLLNIILLIFNGTFWEAASPSNMATVFSPTLLAIIVIMASVGTVTGFFLKHLDSVRKTVAGALEIVFVVFFSFCIFGTPLDLPCVLAALMVGGGVVLFSRPVDENGYSPVPVEPPRSDKENESQDFMLDDLDNNRISADSDNAPRKRSPNSSAAADGKDVTNLDL